MNPTPSAFQSQSHRSAVLTAWLAAVALSFAGATGSYGQQSQTYPAADRIVVIGDVHGAYDAMVDVLQAADVIDADRNWTGGDTHLVSLGDLLDRGADSRAVMDLIMQLQQAAPAAGGRVHMVLGNHEHMNMIGDLRYVSPGEYAAFAAEETAAMRDEAFATWVAEQPDPAAATREQFDGSFPAGYFAHREAFAPDGHYGEWLIDRPAIVLIGDTAFVHGGLSSMVAELGLDRTNNGLHEELIDYFSLRDSLAAAGALPAFDTRDDLRIALEALASAEAPADAAAATPPTEPPPEGMERFYELATEGVGGSLMGPLWYRGSVYCKPLLERPILDAALDSLNARRVVVGHTTTDNRRAQVRHDGHLLMIDTGMLTSYYHGNPSAMIIEDGAVSVQYVRAPMPVPLDTGSNQTSYGLTEAELVRALETAAISSISDDPESGTRQVALALDDVEIKAIFVPNDRGGPLELAAAILDDLIGAEMIAPTVEREIDGVAGALQLVYADSLSEAERLAAGRGFSGFCPIEPQLHLMYAFDALIANEGRSTSNILFVNDVSQLLLTGHTNAFGTSRSLMPPGLDPSVLQIPPAVVEGLRALDEDRLENEFEGLLDRREIRALVSRRDKLIDGR